MEDFLWGFWNGATAIPLLILHLLDVFDQYPVYNVGRNGVWYQFGFVLGAGAPFGGGAASRGRR